MTLAAKSALGFVSSALLAGTTTAVVRPSPEEPRTISKLISSTRPDRRLLFDGYQKKSDGSQEVWKFAWNKYRNDFSSGAPNPFSLNITNVDNAPVEFRNACKKLFSEQVLNTEDEKYTWGIEYCTRPTLVSDWIWGQGYEVVSDQGGEWNTLWNKYKTNNFWQITDSTSNDQAPQAFKTKCKDEANKAQGNKNDVSVTRVIDFCSKKRTN
ncbi:hypothetical protein HF1_02690 [Mycoplasma haemofelis str. Langford 1]|uniref:Lipoprotein n=1 Tax=Mycoplasma haemofelis (strain Langford 1) TaxID=941640 RepID=E8ZKW1_MYCHL|nr:hypothetical protein [Mycoplasma haemofelis]CBY92277.1 hypothetical protein HF1_02690 [Mycoplasma haemofelis str. Langford 1]